MAVRYIAPPICFRLEKIPTVEFKIEKPRTIVVDFANIEVGTILPHYEGEYIVTPRVWSQTLETNAHIMDDNVTILEIPADYTENLTGGYTVSIG